MLPRLARSMRDLQVIVATLKDKGAHLAATEQPVDTSTAAGKAFFDMLGVFAEFETNLRRERQAEGDRRGEATRRLSRPPSLLHYLLHQPVMIALLWTWVRLADG